MDEGLKQFLELAQSFGLWVVFAWLYLSEKKEHNKTRDKWIEDLRDIAGINPHLQRNQPTPLPENNT